MISEITSELTEVIKNAAVQGLTDKEIGRLLGMSPERFDLLKEENPNVSMALWRGRGVASASVAGALYKRALGFSKTRKKQVLNKQGKPVDLEEEVYYPPDQTSIQYFLKNKDQERWGEGVNAGGNVTINIVKEFPMQAKTIEAEQPIAIGEGDAGDTVSVNTI